MDLSHTSRIRFLDQSGNTINGPTEWTPALIEIRDVVQDWSELHLMRQADESLPVSLRVLEGVICVIANWPLSGPGHYTLSLYRGNSKVEEQTITIQPSKISPESYMQLLDDLETRLPAAIALGLQRNNALTGLTFLTPGESTLAMELTRLRRAINGTPERMGLSQVLGYLADDPHKILRTVELWMPRERTRRPHPSQLIQALSRPNNRDKGGLPLRLLDTRVEDSVDVYENRLLKVYTHQVKLHLRRMIRLLQKRPHTNLLEEARDLEHKLGMAERRAAFLNEVTLPANLPIQTTMVLLHRPFYRAAFEGYIEFHSNPMAHLHLEEPTLEAPLENLPHLYQVWGTLEVLTILLEVAGGLGYQVKQQNLVKKDVNDIYIQLLPDGTPVLILEHPLSQTKVQMIPERKYMRHGMLHSISFEQRPDIAIEIETVHTPTRIYIFDPKYKLESERFSGEDNRRPKKEDIDKMHTYRDAIRDTDQHHIVQYAAILYPGEDVCYFEGIEALQAIPGSGVQLEDRLRAIFLIALQS